MTFNDTTVLIKADFEKTLTSKCKTGSIRYIMFMLRYLITNSSFKYCFWYRLASYFKHKNVFFVPVYIITLLMYRHYTFKYGIQIPLCASIGGGLSFNHFSCIVINGSTIIGKNCTIFHGVTCALKMGGAHEGTPIIGDNCVLGPGSKILGNVRIGNDVFVGANAVVTSDIPSEASVGGVPAKVLNYNGANGTLKVRLHK